MSATLEHAIATSTPSERSGRAFRVVRIILGLLLLTAAGLKLYGMNVTAFPRAGWFAAPRVQIMAAEWELVLGLWLLSGVFQFGAWLAAIGTFATFAGVSRSLHRTDRHLVTCLTHCERSGVYGNPSNKEEKVVKRQLNLEAAILGIAVALFVLSALAVPTQQARGDDPIPCGDPPECPAGTRCIEGFCVDGTAPWCLSNPPPSPCSSGVCVTPGKVCKTDPYSTWCICD